MNPMKKSEIVNSKCFSLFGVSTWCCELAQCNEQIHPRMNIPSCTPAYFMQYTSSLTLQVIGSTNSQFIPPAIMLQSGEIAPFTSEHILTPFGHYISPCTPGLWAFYITRSVLKLASVLNDLVHATSILVLQ